VNGGKAFLDCKLNPGVVNNLPRIFGVAEGEK